MSVVAAVLATALVVVVVVVQPIRGRRRYGRLLDKLAADPGARLAAYRQSITADWVVVGVVALIGLLSGNGPRAIGLPTSTLFPYAPAQAWSLMLLGVAAVAAGAGVVWLVPPVRRVQLGRMLRGAVALLPRTARERALFAVLALTAGFCEEVVFRGFGIAYVHWAWPGASATTAVVLTAVAFGSGHLYQGPAGVIVTGVLGALLGWVVVTSGSLVPAIVIHAAIDLRILALPRSMLDALPPGPGAGNGTRAAP